MPTTSDIPRDVTPDATPTPDDHLRLKQQEPASESEVQDTLNSNSESHANAINAKLLQGGAPVELSNLLYSAYGMDAYPGYLEARFAQPTEHVKKLRELEASLRDQISRVQAAIEGVQSREHLLQDYVPLYKWEELSAEEIVHPQTVSALRSGHAATVSGLLTELSPVACSLPLLSDQTCDRLLEECEAFLQWQQRKVENNEPGCEKLMTRFFVLDHLGQGGRHILDVLLNEVMKPLCHMLFPEMEGNTGLDWRWGYVIGYSDRLEGKNRNITRSALVDHTDDSELTLNIALRDDFTGGRLNLGGNRGEAPPAQRTRVVMQKGVGVFHLGQTLHEVEPVESGDRQQLIVWARSTDFRASTCPCCRMYRRFGDDCVCAKANN